MKFFNNEQKSQIDGYIAGFEKEIQAYNEFIEKYESINPFSAPECPGNNTFIASNGTVFNEGSYSLISLKSAVKYNTLRMKTLKRMKCGEQVLQKDYDSLMRITLLNQVDFINNYENISNDQPCESKPF